jgi:peptidylprolyl isomerase
MGFEKKILKEGTGKAVVARKQVTVHCTGFGKNQDLSQKF